MAIRFSCRCGKKLKAPDEKIGKKVLCPACGNPVTVPEDDTITVDEISNSAANLAGDLLRRSAETKKSRPDIDEQGPSWSEDIVEAVKAYSLQILPGVAAVIFLFYATYWLSTSVMTTEPKRPELGRVSGTVTLDGEPLASATVTFEPVKGRKPGSNVSASLGRTDSSGRYSLSYVRGVEGAAVGKHRVMIQARDEHGYERVPDIYNRNTALVEDVEPGNNTIDFELKTTR